MDQRSFLKRAATGAAGAFQADMHDQDHDHQVIPSDPALRTKALESLLVEKGLVDSAALDVIVDMYENESGHATARGLWRVPGLILTTKNGCLPTQCRQSQS